jgi:(4-(4-[2-(gamma-L-glutamylamino)ethyl]phenoxymethyl)furan-2-yl)methanamine synthase
MSVIGMDIGGANLKLAHSDGECLTRPFALWKHPERLADTIREMTREFPAAPTLAVTMTGELADCFSTKREGVRHILNAVRAVAEERKVRVWCTGGEFLDSDFAEEYPLLVASANWHALARWVGRLVPQGAALMVDIGTTTTDLIPLDNGFPVSRGLTDLQRMQHRELEYSGATRTPLAALAHSVPLRGHRCGLSAEVFATTLDLYLWSGDLSDSPHDLNTANGRPATREFSRDRLCRMLCADREEVSDRDLDEICQFLADVQKTRIMGCLIHVLERFPRDCRGVVVSGCGAFLAERAVREVPRLVRAETIRLGDVVGPRIAEAAAAFAVARLAEESP